MGNVSCVGMWLGCVLLLVVVVVYGFEVVYGWFCWRRRLLDFCFVLVLGWGWCVGDCFWWYGLNRLGWLVVDLLCFWFVYRGCLVCGLWCVVVWFCWCWYCLLVVYGFGIELKLVVGG